MILGSTGVGKTLFRNSLTELIAEFIDRTDRTTFSNTQQLKIGDELFRLVDTPGQRFHDSRRFNAIRAASAGGVDGIINVVSFGYHEYNSATLPAIDAAGVTDLGFLERHRKIEIEALKEWTPFFTPSVARWMMTVITKADLWWDEKESVISHYSDGIYSSQSKSVNATPIVLPYCGRVHRFYDQGRVSGAFDDTDRIRLRQQLLSVIVSSVATS